MCVIGEAMKIKACPKCGSKSILMGRMRDGILYGITSWTEVCRECGYQGMPVIFDSEKEYKKFLKELEEDTDEKKKTKSKKESDKALELSEKPDQDKKITKEDKLPPYQNIEVKVRWKVFLISVLLSALLAALITPYFLSQFDVIVAIAGIIYGFIAFVFTIFLYTLFVRFLYKKIMNVSKRKNN